MGKNCFKLRKQGREIFLQGLVKDFVINIVIAVDQIEFNQYIDIAFLIKIVSQR